MIHFRCKYCSQKIRVPENHAGKKGKCPKCESMLVVPKIENASAVISQSNSSDSKISSKDSGLDPRLFDIPQGSQAVSQPVSQEKVPDRTLEELNKLKASLGIDEIEPPAKRKLPWLIDIFLYPTSKAGLTILGIIIIIPLLIDTGAKLLGPLGFFISIPGFFVKLVIGLYMYWYLSECVRDSAEGNLRAPDVLTNHPSFWDMFWQTVRINLCHLFLLGPAGLYSYCTGRQDAIFWSLFAAGPFLFPMALLAVIMFDSLLSGINPVLLVPSVFSTFFQYCGLFIFLLLLPVLFVTVVLTLALVLPFILGYVIILLWIYMLVVGAHLLGRFYYRYQEKLYWEV